MAPTPEFARVFKALKSVLAPYAPNLKPCGTSPVGTYLDTRARSQQ